MVMEEFAILHNFESTQCLIDSNYDSDEETFNIKIKFWSVKVNGFITLTMGWEFNQESEYKQAFEHFKSKDKAIEWINKFESQINEI